MQSPSGSGRVRAPVPAAAPACLTAAQRNPGVSRGRVPRGEWEGQRPCPPGLGSPPWTQPGVCSSTCSVPQVNAGATLVSPPHSLPSSAPQSFNPPWLGPLLSS